MRNPISDYFKDICPCCFGQGKVKAMQSYMTYDAGTVSCEKSYRRILVDYYGPIDSGHGD